MSKREALVKRVLTDMSFWVGATGILRREPESGQFSKGLFLLDTTDMNLCDIRG
jgi:hypothetical protein